MFNTTLTNEYLQCAALHNWDQVQIETLVLNGVRASLLPAGTRKQMEQRFIESFAALSN